jgi:hypothetical protein
MKVLQVAAFTVGVAVSSGLDARADTLNLIGPTSTAGIYSTSALAADANSSDTVDSGGLTGISLWGLLGGANGNITTSTPAGDNGKNAILRYYLVGTGGGAQSVVSLGEINPNFGGTSTTPAFVAFKNTGGSLLSTPELIVPGAPGRTVQNLTNLQLLSVPALPIGPGGVSTSLTLSGLVNSPGIFTLAMLQNNFTPVRQTVGGDTYTGIPLNTFLNPSSSNINSQIVVGKATDGYEVVYSLAELANLNDLLPYADTVADFPADGIARTILPDDNKRGRWISNLSSLEVDTAVTPLPATWTMMLIGLAGLGFMSIRGARRQSMTVGA